MNPLFRRNVPSWTTPWAKPTTAVIARQTRRRKPNKKGSARLFEGADFRRFLSGLEFVSEARRRPWFRRGFQRPIPSVDTAACSVYETVPIIPVSLTNRNRGRRRLGQLRNRVHHASNAGRKSKRSFGRDTAVSVFKPYRAEPIHSRILGFLFSNFPPNVYTGYELKRSHTRVACKP